jgi:predicted  nucleic acid-binding Zn-ribbon protein
LTAQVHALDLENGKLRKTVRETTGDKEQIEVQLNALKREVEDRESIMEKMKELAAEIYAHPKTTKRRRKGPRHLLQKGVQPQLRMSILCLRILQLLPVRRVLNEKILWVVYLHCSF